MMRDLKYVAIIIQAWHAGTKSLYFTVAQTELLDISERMGKRGYITPSKKKRAIEAMFEQRNVGRDEDH